MKNSRLILALIILLVAMIANCEWKNSEVITKNPGAVMEKFYKLLQNEETEKASEMYSHRGQKLTIEEYNLIESMLTWSVDKYKKKDGIKEVIVIEETIIGDYKTAKVKFIIVFNNGDEDDIMQALEKIDGKWYLKTASLN